MKDNYSVRELFRRIINFEETPKTMKWEFGYWGETVLRWYREGLPKKSSTVGKINTYDTVIGPGCPENYNQSGNKYLIDTDISDYFNFDTGMHYVPYHYFYYPIFKEKVIDEDGQYEVKYNNLGIKIR